MENVDKNTPKMMIFTFCEKIIQNKTNQFSLINLFDTIHFKEMPGLISCNAFLQIALSPGNYDLVFKTIEPNGDISNIASQKITREVVGNFSLVMNLNLTYLDLGKYKYQVFIDDLFLNEIEINVVLSEPTNS